MSTIGTTMRRNKRPCATKRNVQVKNCDDDSYIQEKDAQTMTGKILVKDCPCESRFKNNETRLAALASVLTTQLRFYFQQLYQTQINYDCSVRVLDGNDTYTLFEYTVRIPQVHHAKARNAMKQVCKDDKVSSILRNIQKTRQLS